MLKNVVNEQLSEEKMLLFEAQVDTEFVKLNSLVKEMSKESLLEEIS